ncbi:MAG TPA: RHS repeat-associated core domain-containing protein [Acidobacteriaceae bacterium]|nr:RHS repeat-associated core domain-containing protein [Acidobacteriaceae bacterium]
MVRVPREYPTHRTERDEWGTQSCGALEWSAKWNVWATRPRYYNPATGRFLSRDPESGNEFDPKTLHKYLYAGGDPVNAKDPTGKDDLVEEGVEIAIHSKETIQFGAEIALCDNATFQAIGFLLTGLTAAPDAGGTGNTNVGECVIEALKGLTSPGGIPLF